MEIIWSGTLSRSGRTPVPFRAELMRHEGRIVLIERKGVSVTEVSPHEVNGESWMMALAGVATTKTQGNQG